VLKDDFKILLYKYIENQYTIKRQLRW